MSLFSDCAGVFSCRVTAPSRAADTRARGCESSLPTALLSSDRRCCIFPTVYESSRACCAWSLRSEDRRRAGRPITCASRRLGCFCHARHCWNRQTLWCERLVPISKLQLSNPTAFGTSPRHTVPDGCCPPAQSQYGAKRRAASRHHRPSAHCPPIKRYNQASARNAATRSFRHRHGADHARAVIITNCNC